MSSSQWRQLPITTLTASQKQVSSEVVDAGAYTTLEIQARVLKAGGAGNMSLEHAAVNEPDAFTALTGASWAVNAALNTHTTISHFLRYVRWSTDAAVAGGPVALIDIIGKE